MNPTFLSKQQNILKTGAMIFAILFLFSSCKKPIELFYYGNSLEKKIVLKPVPGTIVIKVDETKSDKALSAIQGLGTVQFKYMNVYFINTGSAEKGKSALDKLDKEPWIISDNLLYMAGDSQAVGVTDEIVFALKKTETNEKSSLISKYSLKEVPFTRKGERYYILATVKKGESAIEVSQKLMESGQVEFAHPNFYTKFQLHSIPNDEFFGQQFFLHNTGQTLLNEAHVCTPDADIDAPTAWDVTRGDATITVAVLDEGTERNNPDLPAGRLTILNGSNFVAGENADDPSPTGDGAHGTCCSGIVAAEQNNIEGVSGVAPLCHIMPVKLPFGGGTLADFADAINFAWSNGAHVLSNSWGSSGTADMPVITAAINNAITMGRGGIGSVVVFSAGNTADHAGGADGFVSAPGNAAVADLITVGASNRNDRQANYSPTAPDYDVVAPSHNAYSCQVAGESFEVWTTDIVGTAGYNSTHETDCGALPVVGDFLPSAGTNFNNYTGRMGGTSSSAPEVAGVCALILAMHPTFTPAQVRQRIMDCCDKIGGYTYTAGRCNETGFGRVNALNAVSGHLWMQDKPDDPGTEPNLTSSPFYVSEDIWSRITNDAGTTHENPVYTDPSVPGAVPNAVYVKIRNAGCESGTGTLKLYWAKASSGLSWPAPWDGSVAVPALMGGSIDSKPITVPANSEVTIEFDWFPPNPADYSSFGTGQNHFCLLARIERTATSPFGMEFIETTNLGENVKNNNNIAWKNIHVEEGLTSHSGISGMMIANYSKEKQQTKIKFETPHEKGNDALLKIGSIKVTLTESLMRKWKESGMKGEGFKQEGNVLIINSPDAWIGTFNLNPKEIHGISFETMMNSKPDKNADEYFTFNVSQWSIIKEKEIEIGGVQLQLYPYEVKNKKGK